MTIKPTKYGCVIYLRVSSVEQAEEINLHSQEMKCREYAQQNGLHVVRVFIDPGKTGRNINRKAFQEMLVYCRHHRNELRAVVTFAVDRWARDVGGWAATQHTLDDLGIDFHSVHERIDKSASGRLMGNVHSSFAQYFSDALSEKMSNVIRHRLSRGLFPWKAPLGYKNLIHDRDKRPASGANIVPDPARAPLIRAGFAAVASGLRSIESVRHEVNDLGLRTAKGARVSSETFHRILRCELYAGWIVSGATRVRGVHEAIISEETFQDVQEVLGGKNPDKAPNRKAREDFALRQFVTCANCGRGLTAGYVQGKKAKFAFYWCYNRDCKAVHISKKNLEEQFVSLLGMHQPTQRALLKEIPELAAGRWAAMRDRLTNEARLLSQTKAEKGRLNTQATEKMLRGVITEEQYKAFTETNERELTRLEQRVKQLESERQTLAELTEKTKEEIVDLVSAWTRGTLTQKLDMQRGLFGSHLAYSKKEGFLNTQNFLLMNEIRKVLVENAQDTSESEDFSGEANEEEQPLEEIGVSDGI